MNFTIFGLTLNLTQYIIVFFVCQFINVALNTAKTIVMHKEEKISSSIINAITYGFYCIIVVMTASALPLLITIAITIITNLIGVYFSMIILEKFKKDKLWKVESTISWDYVRNIPYNDQKNNFLKTLIDKINAQNLSYHYIELPNREFLFSFYCKTQKESLALKEILKDYNAKYIVQEENVKL
jgi:hypothetical protein